MASTDVTGTKDTTTVTGESGAAQDTSRTATNKDTTATGGGGVDDPGNSPATQPDTTGAQGGPTSQPTDTSITGTLSTEEPGSPTRNADPKYRAPSDPPPATNKDTSWTDRPISDGSDRPDYGQNMTSTYDTENPTVPLETTSTALAGQPAAPAVRGVARGVEVTLTAVADPAGAPVRGYRVEGSTGGVTFAGRGATKVVVNNLTPSVDYQFRVAAVTDNGVGQFSDWSPTAKALNPDEAGPGHATGVTEANQVNPIYGPDGKIKAGTGGTPGAVQGLTAAADANAGEVVVNWQAPATGLAPTGYTVTASSGESVTVGAVLTATLTGLASGVAVTVTVTPTNARGDGVPATSAAVTPA